MFCHIFTGLLRNQFCCRGHFEYIVETQMDEGGQDDIDIFQMIELAVQGRRRKGHSIFVPSKYVQTVSSADLGVMAAYADTFAAVDTKFAGDDGFAVTDPDSFSGTALDTVDASVAQIFFQVNGMKKTIVHVSSTPFYHEGSQIDRHGHSGAHAQDGVDLHGVRVFFHVGKPHSRAKSQGTDIVRGSGESSLHGLFHIFDTWSHIL